MYTLLHYSMKCRGNDTHKKDTAMLYLFLIFREAVICYFFTALFSDLAESR